VCSSDLAVVTSVMTTAIGLLWGRVMRDLRR